VIDLATETGANVMFLPAELASASERDRLVGEASARMGGLDVLVNNAGASRAIVVGGLETVNEDSLLSGFTMNVLVPIMLSQVALPHLLKSGAGSIVNISSRAATLGTPGSPGYLAYTAGKGGLEAATRAISAEFATRGLRCNAVAPGFITKNEQFGSASLQHLSEVPTAQLTRPTYPEDVAAAVAFLVSSDAATITGITLRVDGGSTTTRAATFG